MEADLELASLIGDDDPNQYLVAKATGYHPVDSSDPEYKMEGGRVGAEEWHGEKIAQEPLYTLDQFRKGAAPYVSVAMDNSAKNPLTYGTMLQSPDFPNVPFRVMDTGAAFKGKGTSRIDIARDTKEGANHEENNGQFRFKPSQPTTDLPNLSMATIGNGGGGLQGISHLNPIGTAQSEIDNSDIQGGGLSSDELSSALEQSQPEESGATMAMPSSATNANPVGMNPDGSVQFDNGMRVYPKDGRVAWDLHGRTFVKTNPYSKMVSVSPPKSSIQRDESGRIFSIDPNSGEAKDITPQGFTPKLDPVITKNLLDRHLNPYWPDGRAMTPKEAMGAITDYDKNTGALAPMQQREVQRITTQAVSSRSLFSRQFVSMYPNYQSVLENVQGKPPDKRNGVDDAFLISAASGLENPGRSTTGEDFRLLMKTAGIRGNLEVLSERISNALKNGDEPSLRGTRILSDAQVKQILDNSTRAIKPRHDEYEAGQAPARKRLEQMGLDPDDYLPNLKINSATTPPPASKPTSSGLDIEGAKRHLQEHPEDEEVRKALQANGAL